MKNNLESSKFEADEIFNLNDDVSYIENEELDLNDNALDIEHEELNLNDDVLSLFDGEINISNGEPTILGFDPCMVNEDLYVKKFDP